MIIVYHHNDFALLGRGHLKKVRESNDILECANPLLMHSHFNLTLFTKILLLSLSIQSNAQMFIYSYHLPVSHFHFFFWLA